MSEKSESRDNHNEQSFGLMRTHRKVFKETVPRHQVIQEHNNTYHYFYELKIDYAAMHIPVDVDGVIP